MRDATSIAIDELIVHIIDARTAGGLVLSHRQIATTGNSRLIDYLVSHLANTVRDPAAFAARFLTGSVSLSPTAQICSDLLSGAQGFISASQQLAIHLHSLISKDKRISSGDLLVCRYHADLAGATRPFIALLKIDPTDGFRHNKHKDANGQDYVELTVEQNMLPSAREKLQKCALIQARAATEEYDMLLVDRQTISSPHQPVARFFLTDFLGAESWLDAPKRTRILRNTLAVAHNRIRADLSPAENDEFELAKAQLLRQEHVNVEEWITDLPLPAAAREEIGITIRKRLPDLEFPLDAATASDVTRKRRFRGDDGLRIEANEEMWGSRIRVERQSPPGEPPFTLITIRTEKWDEVSR